LRRVVGPCAYAGRCSSLEPGEAVEVVDEIGERDLGVRPGEADGADDQVKASFFGAGDVLDARAHLGAGGVAAADVARHRLAGLELGRQAAAVEEPQIGACLQTRGKQGASRMTAPGQTGTNTTNAGTFVTFNVPGSIFTAATAINNPATAVT
jgi:hypothetical protein